jgi:hypothetical protein
MIIYDQYLDWLVIHRYGCLDSGDGFTTVRLSRRIMRRAPHKAAGREWYLYSPAAHYGHAMNKFNRVAR